MIKLYEQNTASHNTRLGKKEQYFNSFFKKLNVPLWYHTKTWLVVILYAVESETILMNISYFIALKFTCLLALWFYNIMHWSFGKRWFTKVCRSFKYGYTSLHIFLNDTFSYHNWSDHYWEAVKLWQLIQVFQNSNFHFKAQILLLATNTFNCFLEAAGSLFKKKKIYQITRPK